MIRKIVVLLLLVTQIQVYGQYPELARTPPMGWNSWNAFGLDINSKKVMAVADSMVSKGLADAGYQYIVIDDGWQIDRDKNGRIIPDSTRFPEGIKFLADYIHSKGLKFGLYTCCGTKTCGGRPGSFGYETIDAESYAEWGVDYIKEDWCFTDGLDTRIQYKKMSDAIRATGRPMLLSLCEWGVSSPWEWAEGIGAMWRTTNDIQDCFDCVRNWGGMGWVPILEKNADLAPYAGPCHWNDPDMLEVGNKALTPTEGRAHFAMWCMLAAPLIAGNNISTMNEATRAILTAPEIIAIDQDPLGIQGTLVKELDGLQVWQKPLQDGSIAVALLNVTSSPAEMMVSLDELGLKKGVESSVRDLWNRKDLAPIQDAFRTSVEPHEVVVVKIKGEKVAPSELKFDPGTLKMEAGNHRIIHVDVYPSTTPITISSSNEDVLNLSIAGVNTYRLLAKKPGTSVIRASTPGGNLSASCNVQVEPTSIPSPWKMDEIKENKASATYEDGVFSIEGAGRDIWGVSDEFTFVSKKTGDHTFISARIISQTNPEPRAKSGLMFREDVAPNSAFVMLCTTPGNGITLQWRDAPGAQCNRKAFGAGTLPGYFKLSRNGSIFSAYKSKDGKNWEQLGEITLNHSMPASGLIGMGVVSHSSIGLNRTDFDQVKVGKTDTE